MRVTKKVYVKYFALFREQAGRSEEIVETQGDTASELYSEISKKYGFSLPPDRVRVSVNDEFEEFEHKIKSDDSIVFIPPVAGG